MKAQFVLDSSLRGGRNIATKTKGGRNYGTNKNQGTETEQFKKYIT